MSTAETRNASAPGNRFPAARITALALLAAAAFAVLALRRYSTFHNETFDLAFYTRIAWGLARGDLYQPLTNSHAYGLHAAPVLYPLAWLGRVLPLVPLLLTVQSALVAAAGVPLARIAVRRIGHPLAADLTLVAYLLYPTVATLATYEFHPSALALFPLALALDALDARRIRAGLLALAVATLCREDVALVAAVTGLALAWSPAHRRAGVLAAAAGALYFALYMFVIAPRYLPAHGSLGLHFGALGGTPSGVLRAVLLHPLATARAVITPAKLLYLPRLLVPVAFLSLLAPRWLLPALVPVAINFLSGFPTAAQLQSHYAALAVPFVFASAAHGAGRLAAGAGGPRALIAAAAAVFAGTLHMQRAAGATPLARRWDPRAFRRDHRSDDLARLLPRIPPRAGVAAPDYVLPHVAERPEFQRVPWTRANEYVLLSTEHRARFGATQELWRSAEEILVRNTLAGERYGVLDAAGQHVLFARDYPARTYARGRYVEFQPREHTVTQHASLGPTLALAAWAIEPAPGGAVVTLYLHATQRWPHDLGFELGWGTMRPHGDRQDPSRTVAALPFDGLFSPAHVRVGEVVRTEIPAPVSPQELRARGVYFGARRIDGSRLDAEGPHWTQLREAPHAP